MIFYARCKPQLFLIDAAAQCNIGLVEYFQQNSELIHHDEVVTETSGDITLETAMSNTQLIWRTDNDPKVVHTQRICSFSEKLSNNQCE